MHVQRPAHDTHRPPCNDSSLVSRLRPHTPSEAIEARSRKRRCALGRACWTSRPLRASFLVPLASSLTLTVADAVLAASAPAGRRVSRFGGRERSRSPMLKTLSQSAIL